MDLGVDSDGGAAFFGAVVNGAALEPLRKVRLEVAGSTPKARDAANPALEVLGIVLGPLNSTARSVREAATKLLEDLVGDSVHIFGQTIRHAQSPAVQARQLGVLAHELAEMKRQGPKWFELTKEQRRDTRIAEAQPLADDLTNLTREILTRFTERNAA